MYGKNITELPLQTSRNKMLIKPYEKTETSVHIIWDRNRPTDRRSTKIMNITKKLEDRRRE
jgi:hypothetical protein